MHYIFLGNYSPGSGSLTIAGGDLSVTGYSFVGYNNVGSASISSGSWTTAALLNIGVYSSGVGSLTISGGTVSAALSVIGGAGGPTPGSGSATISGGTWNTTSNLHVGYAGPGSLTVDGGNVNADAVRLSNESTASATVNLNAGTISTTLFSEGTGSGGSVVNFNGGTLRATANQSDFFQNFESGDIQILSGGGTIDTNSFNIGILTAIQGAGGLTKTGSGTLKLTGANSYSGQTAVSAGGLLIDNAQSGTGAVNVSASATLGGTSSIAAPVLVASSGTILAGDGLLASGTLSIDGGLVMSNNSLISLVLGGAAQPNQHSTLARTGGVWAFDTDQSFTFTLASADPQENYQDVITGLLGSEAGLATIATWNLLGLDPAYSATFSFDGANVDLLISTVPEPGVWCLILLSLGLLTLGRRILPFARSAKI